MAQITITHGGGLEIFNRFSINLMLLSLYHVTRISNNGSAVSGHVAPYVCIYEPIGKKFFWLFMESYLNFF